MSKPIFSILIAFLALWLFGGAYWLSIIQEQNFTDDSEFAEKHFKIQDGEFKVEASTIFAFQASDAEIIINEEQLSILDTLASYLEGSKEKQLRLIAYYGKNETNRTNYENLGIARAETVKYILIRKGAPESRISVEGKLFKKLILNENGMLSGGVEFEFFDNDISNTITEAPFLKEKIFYFKENEYKLSNKDDLVKYAAVLKQYTVDKKYSEIIITGFMELKENQSIGLERTKFIEKTFSKHGIPGDRMSIIVHTAVGKNKTENENNNEKKVEVKVL